MNTNKTNPEVWNNDNQTNDSNINDVFGSLYFSFTQKLLKQKRYSQLSFTHYISCRANFVGKVTKLPWEFNESDIRHQTGMDNRAVKNNCDAFVKAGIFLENGKTPMGSSRYKLDKEAFNTYLKSNEPLLVEVRKFGKRSVASPDQITEKGQSHHLTGSVASPDLRSVASPDLGQSHHLTKNKEENKEKERNTYKQEAFVSISDNSLQASKSDSIKCIKLDTSKSKTEQFINRVKILQNDKEMNYGITISKKAGQLANDLFMSDLSLTPDALFAEYEKIMNRSIVYSQPILLANGSPMANKVTDTYDRQAFNLVRSSDLAFFLNNISNIRNSITNQ
jgi:hypothetical protein